MINFLDMNCWGLQGSVGGSTRGAPPSALPQSRAVLGSAPFPTAPPRAPAGARIPRATARTGGGRAAAGGARLEPAGRHQAERQMEPGGQQDFGFVRGIFNQDALVLENAIGAGIIPGLG